jgi:hypothetical protein
MQISCQKGGDGNGKSCLKHTLWSLQNPCQDIRGLCWPAECGAAEASADPKPAFAASALRNQQCSRSVLARITKAPSGSNMQRDSSGLLETIVAGLSCIIALTAICRKDDDARVCRPERMAVASRPVANPVDPANTGIASEIREMLLHD